MGVSKILYDGIGIDLTQDTVSPSTLLEGVTAHDSSGELIEGTMSGSSVTVEQLDVDDNGTYTAPQGHAYSPVVVAIPFSTIRIGSGPPDDEDEGVDGDIYLDLG